MLRFLTAGESHGQCLTAILEGIPAGLQVDADEINKKLARRQMGYGRGGRMKIETDKADILSGIRFNETMGDPITLQIKNRDWGNWIKKMSVKGEPFGDKVTAARPGHADLVGIHKYDRTDIRDILERASARETAAKVAVGAVCQQFLQSLGISVFSHVVNIGGVEIDRHSIDYTKIADNTSDLNCIDAAAEEKMRQKIRDAGQSGDTLGGMFEVITTGVPEGLGSHIQWDKRLDGRLAQALMSIQAIKAVEIGDGLAYAYNPGSKMHDEMFYDENKQVYRKTNHAGGLEGGMTNGENIILRAVMKPIPTLMAPLHSIDIKDKKEVLASTERSDICAVAAASIVGAAMIAYAVADAVLEQFGGHAMNDIRSSIENYNKRLGKK
ncbi:chorismate synthase [Pectinatus haikarae]|uniref:Chorismate synthase n=1 Tax=Pectinatus haikarae TaxID=349096 RepID=A0ABT9Y6T9_9FIRM|nr:chorismate synthase [Pectinatus haikarae]MDQ0203528.1 chorismate synthase [Pectinatus haikarae]